MRRTKEATGTRGPAKPVRFEDVPARVRKDFERIGDALGPELTLGDFRRTKDGWAATVFTLEGQDGGECLVLAEDGDER